jgi:xylulokinase
VSAPTLVAGVDSSTQSCKVLVIDAASGTVVRDGRAVHPEGTEVDPSAWWTAFERASVAAGGLDDVAAISVGGQQHGMVVLDDSGRVVRPALLWNDTRSAPAATDLVGELGGPQAWADAVGSVPVASFTITKLRWLAEHEPEALARSVAVCLPHDWLTWRLRGGRDLSTLTTDRSDASGTGYWSPTQENYRADLLRLAAGAELAVPAVLAPSASGGKGSTGAVLAPGAGDNAAAALGLGASQGDVVVSVGTSGVVSAASDKPTADPTGLVAGFADATGAFLPLVCTLNASQVLDVTARLLEVDLDALSDLALVAPPGADGLVVVPYLVGERTPDKPFATGAVHGLTLQTSSRAHLARAAVEGVLCGLADGLDALRAQGVGVHRVLLVGGGARSAALRQIAATVLGIPVAVPAPGEYVALGAARQAAWVLTGETEPPQWSAEITEEHEPDPYPAVRERYAEVREMTADRRLPTA